MQANQQQCTFVSLKMPKTMKEKVESLRKEYIREMLDESHTHVDPTVQFEYWFNEALNADLPEPHAMTLSTVSEEGRPSARVVLLRDAKQGVFSFYSNYLSRKGRQLEQNPFGSLSFFWPELERQVRVEGKIIRLDAATSSAYFATRPRGSQIGAWASPQSEVIPNRTFLEEKVQQFTNQFEGKEVPRPEHWGGFGLVADYIEFWQGRESRLHDRIVYLRQNDGSWKRVRLAP